jgi:hypothetical protein
MALVRIYEGREAMDAHHVRVILETHGIAATVIGESLRMARAQIPPTLNTQPTVWVQDTDVAQALAILRDVTSENASAPDWVCSSCGETVEGQFSACWNCGTAQPDAETA